MAEPTCIMHPFSYTSPGFSNESIQEENTMEESVSFGRFTSENLAWERWSSFNNNRNRYVEEAEKYSRPGSVAQKKAYFEAHFKRMAALKAASLLEQQELCSEPVTETETKTGVNDGESGSCFHNDARDSRDTKQVFQTDDDGSEGVINVGVEGFVVHQNELYSAVVAENDEGLSGDNVVQVVETTVNNTHKVMDEIENEDENKNENSVSEGGIALIHQPPLQKINLEKELWTPNVKKNPPLSSFMSPIDSIAKEAPPLFAPSPASYAPSVHPGKENYAAATPMKNRPSIVDPDKKRTPLRASINREFNRILSPVIRKIGSSSKASKDCSTPVHTPAMKLQGSVHGVPDPSMTPDSTKRGNHHDLPAAGHRKPAGPRWHILSDGFKSPGPSKNKTMSPIIPASFCLRGGERGARRKQKLEDKFNATTEKGPQPSKFKEKAEAELNKLRQSFCFKVMSSPDHYTEAEFHNKNESRHRDSPKRSGRRQTEYEHVSNQKFVASSKAYSKRDEPQECEPQEFLFFNA